MKRRRSEVSSLFILFKACTNVGFAKISLSIVSMVFSISSTHSLISFPVTLLYVFFLFIRFIEQSVRAQIFTEREFFFLILLQFVI